MVGSPQSLVEKGLNEGGGVLKSGSNLRSSLRCTRFASMEARVGLGEVFESDGVR